MLRSLQSNRPPRVRRAPWGARIALLAATILAPACARPAAPPPPRAAAATAGAPAGVVYPAVQWERIAIPESAGFSRAGIDSVRSHVARLNTTGLVVVAGGRILVEHGDIEELSYVASVRKSILSMLFGRYVADGTVKLERTLRELGIDDIDGLLPREREAKVADLLGARSGVYHAASNAGDNLADAPPRGSQAPGTYYLYSNWDFNALGTIFEQETGRDIYDALEADLARPIGLQDFRREIHRKSGNRSRSVHPAYHMTFSTRDMARLGYLMLREGRWQGRQVVPAEWVRRSVRAVTRVQEMNPPRLREDPLGYGYLWWVFDGVEPGGAYDGAYMARGAYGQYIAVLPHLDLVVAHKVRAPTDRPVSLAEFLGLLDAIVAAHCAAACGRAA